MEEWFAGARMEIRFLSCGGPMTSGCVPDMKGCLAWWFMSLPICMNDRIQVFPAEYIWYCLLIAFLEQRGFIFSQSDYINSQKREAEPYAAANLWARHLSGIKTLRTTLRKNKLASCDLVSEKQHYYKYGRRPQTKLILKLWSPASRHNPVLSLPTQLEHSSSYYCNTVR